jgi:hypothetical protein
MTLARVHELLLGRNFLACLDEQLKDPLVFRTNFRG